MISNDDAARIGDILRPIILKASELAIWQGLANIFVDPYAKKIFILEAYEQGSITIEDATLMIQSMQLEAL